MIGHILRFQRASVRPLANVYRIIVSGPMQFFLLLLLLLSLNRDADIKDKSNLERILKQISLDDVRHTIKRAEKIRTDKLESDFFMVDSTACYSNPDF